MIERLRKGSEHPKLVDIEEIQEIVKSSVNGIVNGDNYGESVRKKIEELLNEKYGEYGKDIDISVNGNKKEDLEIEIRNNGFFIKKQEKFYKYKEESDSYEEEEDIKKWGRGKKVKKLKKGKISGKYKYRRTNLEGDIVKGLKEVKLNGKGTLLAIKIGQSKKWFYTEQGKKS